MKLCTKSHYQKGFSSITIKTIFCCSVVVTFSVILAGCVTPTAPLERKEPAYSETQLRQAQKRALAKQATQVLGLKRKIGLGRISNETLHGRSLLRDSHDDVLGKQVTDMLSKALVSSGNFLVFERPDISRIKEEARLTHREFDLVGVDMLLLGSLTEFGRNTTGESGFLSASKKQTARAKVDFRLVDVKTGLLVKGFSGAGKADIETVSVAGFGSRASYDATLNDKAISAALSDAINELTQIMEEQPWQADILALENSDIYISGGEAQGVKIGMEFDVLVRGKRVKSKETGFAIQLPGRKIATVKVISLFGRSEQDQGAVVRLVNGTLGKNKLTDLVVQEQE